MTAKDSNPAVETAKNVEGRTKEHFITLATGDKVRLLPVSASLIDEVTSRVKEPEVPMWDNPDKGRPEPNPSDPNYLAELEDASRKRGVAGMDAMIMFGVDLVDGLPDDDMWFKKLRLMERKGALDLSSYDLDDEIDKEFLYKRYIAVDVDTLGEIAKISGISSEDVATAEKSFPSD